MIGLQQINSCFARAAASEAVALNTELRGVSVHNDCDADFLNRVLNLTELENVSIAEKGALRINLPEHPYLGVQLVDNPSV